MVCKAKQHQQQLFCTDEHKTVVLTHLKFRAGQSRAEGRMGQGRAASAIHHTCCMCNFAQQTLRGMCLLQKLTTPINSRLTGVAGVRKWHAPFESIDRKEGMQVKRYDG